MKKILLISIFLLSFLNCSMYNKYTAPYRTYMELHEDENKIQNVRVLEIDTINIKGKEYKAVYYKMLPYNEREY